MIPVRARGFGIVAQLIAGAVVAGLAAGAFAYYNHVVSERAKLEVELSDAIKAQQETEAVAAELRADRDRVSRILADRERTRQADDFEKEMLRAEINDLNKRPEVAAWRAAAVPGVLLERLRGPAPGAPDAGREAVPARQPGAANAGAGVPR